MTQTVKEYVNDLVVDLTRQLDSDPLIGDKLTVYAMAEIWAALNTLVLASVEHWAKLAFDAAKESEVERHGYLDRSEFTEQDTWDSFEHWWQSVSGNKEK